MIEIWKDIVGYEGKYQVSNLGRVKSLGNDKSRKERILRPRVCTRGYLQVSLCKNGKYKNFLIHRLVSSAFLETSENLPQVNHIDQNKQNNRIDNLEFCTAKYNKRYSTAKKIGRFQDGKLIKSYEATQDVKTDGFNQSNVCQCCLGKRNSHKGFQWKYISAPLECSIFPLKCSILPEKGPKN